MREQGARLARLLGDANTFVYLCGHKQMEQGVEAAFHDLCAAHGLDWARLREALRGAGRYHIETY
jgi:benzoyl-CoA 2,3-dioxygenase component A